MKLFIVSFFTVLLLAATANAQLAGGDAYLFNDMLEIGIDGQRGREGAADIPGSHARGGAGGSFGFVANPAADGWIVYDGDFFTPGTPENGFGVKVNGTGYHNNYNIYQIITDSVLTYEENGGCQTVTWKGHTFEDSSLTVKLAYAIKTGDLYYNTTVTLYNNTDSNLTDVYYYKNIDPDNNQPIGGTFVTENTIVAQPDASCQRALVSAEQSSPHHSYIGLGAIGENFRVSTGGFNNRDGEDIWNATGLDGTVGYSSHSDQAISLAYKTDLAAYDSITFTFTTILTEEALDDAFSAAYTLNYSLPDGSTGGGTAAECEELSVDTLTVCLGESVLLSVNGEFIDGVEDWIWTPDTDLDTAGSTSVVATPNASTTYTVNGIYEDCLTLQSRSIYIETIGEPFITTISEDITINEGESTLLEATGGVAYNWFPTTGLSDPAIAMPTATPTETTEYYVAITAGEESCNQEDTLSILVTVIDDLGLFSAENKVDVTIAPNPFSDQTTLYFATPLTANHSILLYDVMGQVVLRKNNVTGSTVTLQKQNLPTGVYFVTLTDELGNVRFTKKLIAH